MNKRSTHQVTLEEMKNMEEILEENIFSCRHKRRDDRRATTTLQRQDDCQTASTLQMHEQGRNARCTEKLLKK